MSHRALRKGNKGVSSLAYAALYYQALREDAAVARAFHAEMSATGHRTSRAIDLETTLYALGKVADGMERSEAQYQLLRGAWNNFLVVGRAAA